MDRRLVALIAVLLFVPLLGQANPPEYIAGSSEPAETAGELASPLEEITPQPAGLRLASFVNEPFFRDSIFSFLPRFYYRYLDDGKGLHDAFAVGGEMMFTTGWWRDILQLGVAGYTTQPVVTPHDPGGTTLLRPNGDGFSVLGQSWAKLKFDPVTVTLFRQEMDLPFINGDDTFMIPNTFEAYRLDVIPSDIARFGIAYVNQEKTRNSAEFRPMSQVAGVSGVDRGTSVAGFVIGSNKTTYFGAIDELTWDLFNAAYLEAGRTWQISNDLQLRGQFQFVDQRSVGTELLGTFSTQLYGTSFTASYRSALITLAFTSIADGSKVLRPFGGTPSFNALMISKFDGAGEDTFRVGLSYDFARLGLNGLKAFANYAHGELPAGQHEDELDVTADYRIAEGALRNVWLRVRFGRNSPSNRAVTDDLRVILNYTVTF
jgi:hypothetical protein